MVPVSFFGLGLGGGGLGLDAAFGAGFVVELDAFFWAGFAGVGLDPLSFPVVAAGFSDFAAEPPVSGDVLILHQDTP